EFQDQFREAMREAEMADIKKDIDEVTGKIGSGIDPFKELEQAAEWKPTDATSSTAPPAADAPPAPPAPAIAAEPATAAPAEAAPAAGSGPAAAPSEPAAAPSPAGGDRAA